MANYLHRTYDPVESVSTVPVMRLIKIGYVRPPPSPTRQANMCITDSQVNA